MKQIKSQQLKGITLNRKYVTTKTYDEVICYTEGQPERKKRVCKLKKW